MRIGRDGESDDDAERLTPNGGREGRAFMRLTREIRFSIDEDSPGAALNSWSGSNGSQRLTAFWTMRITVEGSVDARTGYLCDLRRLDAMGRDVLVPWIRETVRVASDRRAAAGVLMRELLRRGEAGVPRGVTLYSVALLLSPQVGYEARREESPMIRVTHSYEFCAAHRLRCTDFSAEENLRVFGKCSNPHGHGHNYVLEVTVAGEPDPRTGIVAEGPQLDHLVKTHVLDVFDHKNLNVECEEFTAMNPSVENIAQVIWRRLDSVLPKGRLANVRVWETAKTFADCSRAD